MCASVPYDTLCALLVMLWSCFVLLRMLWFVCYVCYVLYLCHIRMLWRIMYVWCVCILWFVCMFLFALQRSWYVCV